MFVEFQKPNGLMVLVNIRYVRGVYINQNDICFLAFEKGNMPVAESYTDVVKKIRKAMKRKV